MEMKYLLTVLLSICVIIMLFYLVKWRLSRQHLYKLAAKVPPLERMLPFIGHAAYALGGTEGLIASSRLAFGTIRPPQTVWLCHILFFGINRAEDAEVVLNKCLSKHDLYRFTLPLGGAGIFALPVPEWRRHRKVISPTFNQKILDKFVEIFSNEAEIFVEQLKSKNGQLIDILNYTYKYSLNAVTETAMGIKTKTKFNNSEIEHAVKRGMEIAMIRLIFPPYHIDWIYKFTNLFREERKCIETFRNFITKTVEAKIADYRNEVAEKCNVINSEEKERFAFLDLLIELSENGENWTFQELIDEVSTFMIGGADPGAAVSSFTMLMLGMHPEIQQSCYEEVMEVLGSERQLECTDLRKLVYLEKVIKETLRLFPLGPMILRKLDEDTEVGGYSLPKGAGLVIHILSMHYSELYYKDPWKFDPERFSPEEIAKRHKYAYLPFSAGPRNCIGMQYSMMSLKTLLAVTLRNYRIETTYKNISDIRITQEVIITSVEGFPVRLFSRN